MSYLNVDSKVYFYVLITIEIQPKITQYSDVLAMNKMAVEPAVEMLLMFQRARGVGSVLQLWVNNFRLKK